MEIALIAIVIFVVVVTIGIFAIVRHLKNNLLAGLFTRMRAGMQNTLVFYIDCIIVMVDKSDVGHP